MFVGFIALLLLNVSNLNGVMDIYDILTVVRHRAGRSSTSNAPGFYISRVIDEGLDSWKSDSKDDQYSINTTISFKREFISIIRILKERDGIDLYRINLRQRFNIIHSFEINITKGWNYYDLNGKYLTDNFILNLLDTQYNYLELAEIQVFSKVKAYSSCLEWSVHSDINQEIVFLHETFNVTNRNVAKIESGSKCISSSGHCLRTIEDELNLFDQLWTPKISDNNPYLRIKFFDKYIINQIILTHPKNNSIDYVKITNDDISINVYPITSTNTTKTETNIFTSYIQLNIFKSNQNSEFYGIFEIVCFSRTPRVAASVVCLKTANGVETRLENNRRHHNAIIRPNDLDLSNDLDLFYG